MSLDVYLSTPPRTKVCVCPRCDNEHQVEGRDSVYSANITHNLTKMASEAGIYKHLWRPEELNITTASELVEPLRVGLALLKADPERYKAFDAKNGWGRYENLVTFVEQYLEACEEYPNATVRASR